MCSSDLLWQFVRMPFGYKNGPSIFQHIMQNVLALFLWIFTLVYINDIIIFSLTLEDHISHLDQVFKAIEDSRVTLSITKCHFRYQSLLLLGQKVSWLGLSTHKEKVDVILLLDELKDRHNLQVFLGMMVYFSAYIPFYAWIAGPLFNLLKGSVNGNGPMCTPKPSNSVSRFWLTHLFMDMRNQDLLIDCIWMLVILD